jgi:hypothetical protein
VEGCCTQQVLDVAGVESLIAGDALPDVQPPYGVEAAVDHT